MWELKMRQEKRQKIETKWKTKNLAQTCVIREKGVIHKKAPTANEDACVFQINAWVKRVKQRDRYRPPKPFPSEGGPAAEPGVNKTHTTPHEGRAGECQR